MEIIDALVATLSLDDKEFQAAVKRTRESRKRMRDDFEDTDKRIQTSSKRTEESFRSVRNEVGRLFLAFAGAKSLTDFVTGIISGDAATGRMAANLGIATERLSVWESALKTVGGTAANADASLSSLQNMYENFTLRGDASKAGELGQLGMSYRDLKDPDTAMLKLASASERMNRQKFVNLARSIGVDDNTINLIVKGRAEVEKILETQRKLGAVTQRDAEAAARFDEAWANLTTAIKGQARPVIEKLALDLTNVASRTDAIRKAAPFVAAGIAGIGIAAGIALGPVALLAAALAGIATWFVVNKDRAASAFDILGWKALAAYHEMRANHTDNPVIKERELKAANDYRQKIADATSAYYGEHGYDGGAPSGANASGGQARHPSRFGAPTDGDLARLTGGGVAAARAAVEAAGGRVTSDHRTWAQQNALYQKWLAYKAGRGPPANRAAPPGHSAHESDQALDVGLSLPLSSILAALRARGFNATGFLENDHYHVSWAGRAAAARGGRHGARGSTVNTGPITIYTNATDARGIARDLGGELSRRAIVVQANSGLEQ